MSQGTEESPVVMPPSAEPEAVRPLRPAASSRPSLELSRIAQDLQIRKVQVESVVRLLDDGNTVPFITRYRRELTGGLGEEMVRAIQGRLRDLRRLADRRQTILKLLSNQRKLSDELRAAILEADSLQRIDDLYLPFKEKKRTPASVARERGLDALAQAVWDRDAAIPNLAEALPSFVNPEQSLNTPEDVQQGVQHILAERIAEDATVRAAVRHALWETGKLCTSKKSNLKPDQSFDFKDYFQFCEPVREIPPHRVMAINRGEKEGVLQVRLEWDAAAIERVLFTGDEHHPPAIRLADHPHADFLKATANDALIRLILPGLEREIRKELTSQAEKHAVEVFARNLRSMLLSRPLRDCRVLAIDPGYRTGCRVAVLGEAGTLLEEATIFPNLPPRRPFKRKAVAWQTSAAQAGLPEAAPATTSGEDTETVKSTTPPSPANGQDNPKTLATTSTSGQKGLAADAPDPLASSCPPSTASEGLSESKKDEVARLEKRTEALAKLREMVCKYHVRVIAIGNGSACRETEELVSELIAGLGKAAETQKPGDSGTGSATATDLHYTIVNEAGANEYAASAIGREEFPNFDGPLRAAISIGRRLQDPLSEWVKVDPYNIGVGLYQHDIEHRHLRRCLDDVIESCVNHVGVDVNTAGVSLLRHVSGLNQFTAREIVEHRTKHGPFRTREQLLQVPGMSPQRYEQAAGFLQVKDGDNPLDRTCIHPENYDLARHALLELGFGVEAYQDRNKLAALREQIEKASWDDLATRLGVSVPVIRDLLGELAWADRDPRDDQPLPIFRQRILKLEDLQPGMELQGTVLNVVDFGAFIDVGLKDSGLVHISQLANRYVKSPYDVVSVGQAVTVWVMSVDQERRRVSLSMIRPGSPRQLEKRGSKSERRRRERGSHPPRNRRPEREGAGTEMAASQGGETAPTAAVAELPKRGERRHGRQGDQRRQRSARVCHLAAQETAQGPPPRSPHKPKPKPHLSQAALKGAAPLRTFSELAAFLEARGKDATSSIQAPATTDAEQPQE